MNNENTVFNAPNSDNERTILGTDSPSRSTDNPTGNQPTNSAATAKGSKPMWKKVVVGGVSGIALGAGAVLLSGSKPVDADPTEGEGEEASSMESLTDGEVAFAHSVNDDMTFGEAFAAARAEVGPGGVFEWHGHLYGTYYENEWDNMSAAERDEYNDHFAWSHNDNSTEASHDNSAHNGAAEQQQDTHAHQQPAATQSDDVVMAEVEEAPVEVEVLGVGYDESIDATVGVVEVDQQTVFLFDVDNNGTFDVMAADVNGNNTFDDNEIYDISDQGITTDDLC